MIYCQFFFCCFNQRSKKEKILYLPHKKLKSNDCNILNITFLVLIALYGIIPNENTQRLPSRLHTETFIAVIAIFYSFGYGYTYLTNNWKTKSKVYHFYHYYCFITNKKIWYMFVIGKFRFLAIALLMILCYMSKLCTACVIRSYTLKK